MPLAQDVLRPGYSQKTVTDRKSADGFYAETAANGSLLHFGFYRNGEPRGWTIDADGTGFRATRVQERISQSSEEPEDESWLNEMIEQIYREAEAEHYVCSFCGKSNKEVATLIAGPERYTFICDECIETCARIIGDQRDSATSTP